jgi:hypothetical protein
MDWLAGNCSCRAAWDRNWKDVCFSLLHKSVEPSPLTEDSADYSQKSDYSDYVKGGGEMIIARNNDCRSNELMGTEHLCAVAGASKVSSNGVHASPRPINRQGIGAMEAT